MKRVLITGASGMLGSTLCKDFEKDFEIYSTGNSYYPSQPKRYLKFDLSSSSYEDLIDWSDPDVIIHSAALTDGNFCKKNPELAFNINGLSVQKFIEATEKKV